MAVQDKLAEIKRPRKSPARKREELRAYLWPNCEPLVWDRHYNHGFVTIPRLLPLVATLIQSLCQKGDATSVYWELWSRSFDEGLVTVTDEEEQAFCAGYTGPRAVRTWRERIDSLAKWDFIWTKPAGNRTVGHILILNPLMVAAKLRRDNPPKVPDSFWTMFRKRASDIGADIPESDPLDNYLAQAGGNPEKGHRKRV